MPFLSPFWMLVQTCPFSHHFSTQISSEYHIGPWPEIFSRNLRCKRSIRRRHRLSQWLAEVFLGSLEKQQLFCPTKNGKNMVLIHVLTNKHGDITLTNIIFAWWDHPKITNLFGCSSAQNSGIPNGIFNGNDQWCFIEDLETLMDLGSNQKKT